MLDKIDKWLKSNVGQGKKVQAHSFDKKKSSGHKKHRKGPVRHAKKKHSSASHSKGKLKIIALGGLEEIGKNMTVIEYENDIVIVDMGFQFPEEDMLGVDYIIPDTSYLDDKLHKVRGIIITHGHLDHIGAIPYLFEKFSHVPFYSTKLTNGLVQKRLEEFKFLKRAKTHVLDPDKDLRLGAFHMSFFRVNHSIPDGIGVFLRSPAGNIIHTGDFKFDFTPADGVQADYQKLAAFSNEGVDILLADSTNAQKPGHTVSEKTIGENLENIIRDHQGRVIIASFSSLIGRIQQIVNAAEKYKRKIYVSGRSMVENIKIATKLGYLHAPKGMIQDLRRVKRNAQIHNPIVLTTGSQGESVSSLTRMAMKEHKHIRVNKGDTIVLSSSPIVGNERAIANVVNTLCNLGAKVITNNIMDIHVSGHGNQEDIKLMHSLTKPRHVMPIHGELQMRRAHGKIAESLGLPKNHVLYANNGSVVELSHGKARVSDKKIEMEYIIVDGHGIGNVGATVLKERQEMAQNGVVIVMIKADKKTKKLVRSPKIISKGFMYSDETKKIEEEIIKATEESYKYIVNKDPSASWDDIKKYVNNIVANKIHHIINRAPLIVPIIVVN